MSAFQIVAVSILGALGYTAIGGYVGGVLSAYVARSCSSCKGHAKDWAEYQQKIDRYHQEMEKYKGLRSGYRPSLPSYYGRNKCTLSHNISGFGAIWPVFVPLGILFGVAMLVFLVSLGIYKAATPACRAVSVVATKPYALGHSYYTRKETRKSKMEVAA